jgi:lipoate-protein ligase A
MVRGRGFVVMWRLIGFGVHDAFVNMAVDEAVFAARVEGLVPNTLRLYRWKPSAVSVGRFQKTEDEVQLENCRISGVDVVRRITGGGTVYHDSENEVTYSVVVSKRELGTEDITEVYSRIYAGLVEALRILGVRADFCEGDAKTCPNLTVKGRKISGSAQSHRKGVALQHGTLLVDVDLERMFGLLRVPWAKTCMEIVNVARHRITSIRSEVGREVPIEEVSRALVEGFQKVLGADPVESELTKHEQELAEELCRSKYATEDWNLRGLIASEKLGSKSS